MSDPTRTQQAWVHRTSPSGFDQLQNICLPDNVIVTGWSSAEGLEKIDEWYAMREVIKEECYPEDDSYRRAGSGTASMWKFLWDMAPGDYVVVPHWGGVFYVAEITGPPFVVNTKAARDADSIYRRKVKWLNDKQPIARTLVKSGLRSRMKIRQTTAQAGEFVSDIAAVLATAARGSTPTQGDPFLGELRQNLIKATLKEIHSGYMDERKFETLIKDVMIGMGAKGCEIIARQNDNGVDVRAEFWIGPTEVVIGVQAKWHKGKTDSHWLDHFVSGLKSDGIDIGWFITSADLSDDFEKRAADLSEKSGKDIRVINGSEFAAMVVDYALISAAQ
jgi:predicted Mrr-cat superfamily restriction endonuclease